MDSNIFRVFVSSTFSDMAEERNALHERVFPRLRKLCTSYGARFQPIDLRWGISDEAAYNQQTVAICMAEIERCQQMTRRPNFIVLLGNRYGWQPPAAGLRELLFQELGKWRFVAKTWDSLSCIQLLILTIPFSPLFLPLPNRYFEFASSIKHGEEQTLAGVGTDRGVRSGGDPVALREAVEVQIGAIVEDDIFPCSVDIANRGEW